MAAITGAMAGARLGPSALPGELIGQLNDRGRWRAAQLTELAERISTRSAR
jgi:ADP-ribosylglycohydrolase